MTVRVNTGVEGHDYDQEGVTFQLQPAGELMLLVPSGTLAIYAVGNWSHVVDRQFTAPTVAAGAPPTAGAASSGPANQPPPEPTPIVTTTEVPVANQPPPPPVDQTPPAEPAPPANEPPPVPEPEPEVDTGTANPPPPA